MLYNKLFKEEIVKLLIKDKTNDNFFELDEGLAKVVYEKISLLKFQPCLFVYRLGEKHQL